MAKEDFTQSGIQVIAFDSYGPEVEENVASIVIADPDTTPQEKDPAVTYCIGYRYHLDQSNRSGMSNPQNWTYDHANRWERNKCRLVSYEELENVLRRHGSSTAQTLDELCQRYKKFK